MSEKHTDTGVDPQQHPGRAAQDAQAAQARAQAAQEKQQAARAEKEAQRAEDRAERVEDKAQAAKADEAEAKAGASKDDAKPAKADEAEAKADDAKPAKSDAKSPAKKAAKKTAEPAEETIEVVEKEIKPKQKPELDPETIEALEARADKRAKTPAFRRQEWWRYKKLGGKHAPWRRPRGIHSKMRRHFKYRPPLVSIGYRGPRAARGLHPSGFEEVLVYRPEDLNGVDPKVQAARVGGTVGGRKAELIEKEADKLGIRILNRRN